MTTITIAADSVKLTKDMIAMLNNSQEHITNIQLDHTSVFCICGAIVLIVAIICVLIGFVNYDKKKSIIKNLIKNDDDLKKAITDYLKRTDTETLTGIVDEVLTKRKKEEEKAKDNAGQNDGKPTTEAENKEKSQPNLNEQA